MGNIGAKYRAKRSHIKIALNEGNIEAAMRVIAELTEFYTVKDDGQIIAKPKKKKKKQQKKSVASKPKPAKKKKKQKKVNYDNEQKRRNREFVAESFEEYLFQIPADKLPECDEEMFIHGFWPHKSVKKALVLPSEDLVGLAQFFEMGVFDQNTQLICVECEGDIYDQWTHNDSNAFMYKLRQAYDPKKNRTADELEKIALENKPILIKGTIGDYGTDDWSVNLDGIDGIDFVWLDFMYSLLPRYCEWIRGVLRDKLTKNATVNVTTLANSWRQKKSVTEPKRKMIDQMHTKGLISDDVLEDILENEFGDGQHETWRQDNVLIGYALSGEVEDGTCWIRKHQCTDLLETQEEKNSTSIQKYTGSKLEMATHKFYRADSTIGGLEIRDNHTLIGYGRAICQLMEDHDMDVDEATKMLEEAYDSGDLPYTEVGNTGNQREELDLGNGYSLTSEDMRRNFI